MSINKLAHFFIELNTFQTSGIAFGGSVGSCQAVWEKSHVETEKASLDQRTSGAVFTQPLPSSLALSSHQSW